MFQVITIFIPYVLTRTAAVSSPRGYVQSVGETDRQRGVIMLLVIRSCCQGASDDLCWTDAVMCYYKLCLVQFINWCHEN